MESELSRNAVHEFVTMGNTVFNNQEGDSAINLQDSRICKTKGKTHIMNKQKTNTAPAADKPQKYTEYVGISRALLSLIDCRWNSWLTGCRLFSFCLDSNTNRSSRQHQPEAYSKAQMILKIQSTTTTICRQRGEPPYRNFDRKRRMEEE
uniref:Uncharacterized protein n=1 Tax=Glossina pallidipes TaxID=7398 RepID=A0A1A9ZXR5_GLOPL